MLYEDFHKLIVSQVVRERVYKILIIMSRVNNEIYDKDMRYKLKELKHI
jgi:hypothetical protein